MNTKHAEALADLLASREPLRKVIRGSIGDGNGNVEYPTLADFVYVTLRDNTIQIVRARNLTVPSLYGVAVDVEKTTLFNKDTYRIVGLTEGVQFPYGTQPIAQVMLHAYTHEKDGYDEIDTSAYTTVASAVSYTMLPTDSYVGITDTTAARSVFLPNATLVPDGKVVHIKDETNHAGTNNISVFPYGSQQIDLNGAGAAQIISGNGGGMTLIQRNKAWWITSLKA